MAWLYISKVAACDICRIYSLIYALNHWKLGTKCQSGFARKLFQSPPVRQLISGWKSGRPFHLYGNRFHCRCRRVKLFWTSNFHVKVLHCSGMTGKGTKFFCMLWSIETACMLKEEGRKKQNKLVSVLVKNLEFIFLQGHRTLYLKVRRTAAFNF